MPGNSDKGPMISGLPHAQVKSMQCPLLLAGKTFYSKTQGFLSSGMCEKGDWATVTTTVVDQGVEGTGKQEVFPLCGSPD